MRYGNKWLNHFHKIARFIIYSILLLILIIILVKQILPAPTKKIAYEYFLYGKIFSPLVRVFFSKELSPQESKILTYEFTMKPEVWQLLERDGKNNKRYWYNSYLSFGNTRNVPVEIRGRGESEHNWIGTKKSIWVRARASTKINGMDKFSFRNPTGADYSLDLLAEKIGVKIGLFFTPVELANIFINRQYSGIYLQIMDEGENLFFVKNQREPSNIFIQDEIDQSSDVFFQPKYWKVRNTKNEKNPPLDKAFLEMLTCLKNNCSDLDQKLNFTQFIKNIILFELLGSSHLDQNHNHRIYLDPKTGRIEPIAWDIGSSNLHREYDQSFDYISQYILGIPKYREEKLKLQNEILQNKITEKFLNDFYYSLLSTIAPYFYADKNYGNNWAFTYHYLLSLHKNYLNLIQERRKLMLSYTALPSGVFSLRKNAAAWDFQANTPHTFNLTGIHVEKCSPQSIILSANNLKRNIPVSGASLEKAIPLFANWERSQEITIVGGTSANKKILSANLIKKPIQIKIEFPSSTSQTKCENLQLRFRDRIQNKEYILSEGESKLQELQK